MDLLLGQVANAGLVKAELITVGATEDLWLDQFILASLVTARGKLRRDLRRAHWLPGIGLNAKDTVVVHSGRGKNSREPTEDGRTRHHIYLNQRTALWEASGVAPSCCASPRHKGLSTTPPTPSPTRWRTSSLRDSSN